MPLFSRRQVLQTMPGPVAAPAFPGTGIADEYPTRPIRLVIPYAASGSGEQISRPWADKIASLLGPTYIENTGGALGCSAVAQSAQENYRSQGMEPDINSSPGRFQRLAEDELKSLAPFIKSIGLTRN